MKVKHSDCSGTVVRPIDRFGESQSSGTGTSPDLNVAEQFGATGCSQRCCLR